MVIFLLELYNIDSHTSYCELVIPHKGIEVRRYHPDVTLPQTYFWPLNFSVEVTEVHIEASWL